MTTTTTTTSRRRAFATVTGPTALYTASDGHTTPVADTGDIRAAVVRLAVAEAGRTGAPVELITSGDRGAHHLLIATDGTLTPLTHHPTGSSDEDAVVDGPSPGGEPGPSRGDTDLPASDRVGLPDVRTVELPNEGMPVHPAPGISEAPASARRKEPNSGTPEQSDSGTPEAPHSHSGTAADADPHPTASGAEADAPSLTAWTSPTAVAAPASTPLTGRTRRGQRSDSPDAEGRVSFITAVPPAPAATTGWRRVLGRLGLSVGPSPYEVTRAGWVEQVSRQWAGCRTIAVVNGKGGVGKTMTTGMLAAVYARNGGGNVLAWDNNDTRGTLGWRTETGRYDTTVRDLLPAAPELLSAGAAVSDIAGFVHHQVADRYDVLRSNPELLATDQRIDQDQFDLLMRVAARYYRLVVFDSGNDESADRWIRMIDSTRQLVIPTLAAPEPAESAALLLDALRDRDEHSAALADGAVVVVTQAEPADTGQARRIADGFEGRVRQVETVPFDPALKSGPLRLDTLRPATRDAWLRVAAAAADTL